MDSEASFYVTKRDCEMRTHSMNEPLLRVQGVAPLEVPFGPRSPQRRSTREQMAGRTTEELRRPTTTALDDLLLHPVDLEDVQTGKTRHGILSYAHLTH